MRKHYILYHFFEQKAISNSLQNNRHDELYFSATDDLYAPKIKRLPAQQPADVLSCTQPEGGNQHKTPFAPAE